MAVVELEQEAKLESTKLGSGSLFSLSLLFFPPATSSPRGEKERNNIEEKTTAGWLLPLKGGRGKKREG